MGGDGSLGALLWLVLCVVLVIGLAYWYTRWLGGRGTFGGPGAGGDLEVRSQLPLGRDQRLVLVRAGERWLLLGVTASSVSTLAEFTPEEAVRWQKQKGTPEQRETPSFREAFLTLMKQTKERR